MSPEQLIQEVRYLQRTSFWQGVVIVALGIGLAVTAFAALDAQNTLDAIAAILAEFREATP